MRETVRDIVASVHGSMAVCPDDAEGRVMFATLTNLASASEVALDEIWKEAAKLHLKRSGLPENSDCTISDLPDIMQQRVFSSIEFYLKILSTYLSTLSSMTGRRVSMRLLPAMMKEPVTVPPKFVRAELPDVVEHAGIRAWRELVDKGDLSSLYDYDSSDDSSDSGEG